MSLIFFNGLIINHKRNEYSEYHGRDWLLRLVHLCELICTPKVSRRDLEKLIACNEDNERGRKLRCDSVILSHRRVSACSFDTMNQPMNTCLSFYSTDQRTKHSSICEHVKAVKPPENTT